MMSVLIYINSILLIVLLYLEIRSLKRLLSLRAENDRLIRAFESRLSALEAREKFREAGLEVGWSWNKK